MAIKPRSLKELNMLAILQIANDEKLVAESRSFVYANLLVKSLISREEFAILHENEKTIPEVEESKIVLPSDEELRVIVIDLVVETVGGEEIIKTIIDQMKKALQGGNSIKRVTSVTKLSLLMAQMAGK